MLEEIKKAVAEQFSCTPGEVEPETSFRDDLGADSLDLYELISALEEKYNLEIPSEELSDLDIETVQDVLDFLAEKGIED
jgi:acyl carrier protein